MFQRIKQYLSDLTTAKIVAVLQFIFKEFHPEVRNNPFSHPYNVVCIKLDDTYYTLRGSCADDFFYVQKFIRQKLTILSLLGLVEFDVYMFRKQLPDEITNNEKSIILPAFISFTDCK